MKRKQPVCDCWSNLWHYIAADVEREYGHLRVETLSRDPSGFVRLLVYRRPAGQEAERPHPTQSGVFCPNRPPVG
jgi:hypothetical protein